MPTLKEKEIDNIRVPEGTEDNSLWSVVKVRNNKGNKDNMAANKPYELEEGNLLKFGRVRFRIQSISSSIEEYNSRKEKGKILNLPTTQAEIKELNPKIDSLNSESETNPRMCRFCLFEQSEPDDPLIQPCTCSGSMKYIHINCLRKWLNSKIQTKKSEFMSSITWKSLECELCKKQYEYDLFFNGKRYILVDIPPPEEFPFLQIELLGRDNNCVKGVYQVSLLKKKQLKIVSVVVITGKRP